MADRHGTGRQVKVALLAGGTGGGKLAAGMQARLGADLSVIANTGDDIEILGVHVSPDPDLVTYWLSGEIDEQRGWGIRDDSFTVFERLAKLGAPEWFALSDRDLAACLHRQRFLADGAGDRGTGPDRPRSRRQGFGAADVRAAGAHPVRTAAGWRDVQEYLIQDRAEPEVEAVELRGISSARPTPEVSEAIAMRS